MTVSFLLVNICKNLSHAGVLKGPREPTFGRDSSQQLFGDVGQLRRRFSHT